MSDRVNHFTLNAAQRRTQEHTQMTEYTKTDLQGEADALATQHARETQVIRQRRHALWFLAVHNGGAQLRATWCDVDGNAYSTSEAL